MLIIYGASDAGSTARRRILKMEIRTTTDILAVLQVISGGFQAAVDDVRKLTADCTAPRGEMTPLIKEIEQIANLAESIQATALQLKHITRSLPEPPESDFPPGYLPENTDE